MLADSLYGSVTEFREQLQAAGGTFCVGIDSTLKVIAADADLGPIPEYRGRGQPPTRPLLVRARPSSLSVGAWATEHVADFRTVTWRQGSKGKMTSRFAVWRVRPAHKLSRCQRTPRRLLVAGGMASGAEHPTKYFFSNQPASTSLKHLVRTAKNRWWIEHSYRELKDELGLDHFEGRSWQGWHHHVVLVSRMPSCRPCADPRSKKRLSL